MKEKFDAKITVPKTHINFQRFIKRKIGIRTLLVVIIVLVICFVIGNIVFQKREQQIQVETISTLEKVIDVNELSTFTAVYNGIAQAMNEKEPDKIDYYVSYEARVKAGIDFTEIDITPDFDHQTIHITIPDIYITDINVDISSLDFIFMNQKLNTSSITQQAYKICEEDVKLESKQQSAIRDLAKQNAKNTIIALVTPFLEQSDIEYTLEIE